MPNPQTRLIPTGACWCGCAATVGLGSFFAPGHDKIAEGALLAAHYGASVPQLLHDHGYGPDKPVTRAALATGKWVNCPRPGCTYSGSPNSVSTHARKPHPGSKQP